MSRGDRALDLVLAVGIWALLLAWSTDPAKPVSLPGWVVGAMALAAGLLLARAYHGGRPQ